MKIHHHKIHQAQQEDENNPGNNRCEKTLQHRLTCNPCVNDLDRAWRYEKAERGCIGDQGGRESLGVFVALKSGQHHTADTGQCGCGAARNGTKNSACEHRSASETAAQPTQNQRSDIDQRFGQLSPVHDRTGQNE